MSTLSTPPLNLPSAAVPPPAPDDDFPYPPTDLPIEDGVNLESDWHRLAMTLLIDCIRQHGKGRTDFYVGGNMFIHFSEQQVRNCDFRGPDFFYVKNADGTRLRDYWATWLEGGQYPDVIVELTSRSTKREDLGRKKDIYQNVFRTPEYFCYDPRTKELQGWRLINTKYEPIVPDQNGRLECQELGMFFGKWQGIYASFDAVWPRFFDAQGNLVLTVAEAAQRDLEMERQRAESLEAEIAMLRAQLESKQN